MYVYGMVIKTYIPHQLSDVIRLNICGVTFKITGFLKTGFIKTNGKTCWDNKNWSFKKYD